MIKATSSSMIFHYHSTLTTSLVVIETIEKRPTTNDELTASSNLSLQANNKNWTMSLRSCMKVAVGEVVWCLESGELGEGLVEILADALVLLLLRQQFVLMSMVRVRFTCSVSPGSTRPPPHAAPCSGPSVPLDRLPVCPLPSAVWTRFSRPRWHGSQHP